MLWCQSHMEAARSGGDISRSSLYKNNLKPVAESVVHRISVKTYTVEDTPHIPKRTVRRVHVMPWATPIRRIGQSQSGKGKGDVDDNNG